MTKKLLCPQCSSGELFQTLDGNLHCDNCQKVLWQSKNQIDSNIDIGEQHRVIESIPIKLLSFDSPVLISNFTS